MLVIVKNIYTLLYINKNISVITIHLLLFIIISQLLKYTFYRKKENWPADNAGLFSYVYITWMTPYLWKAYKKGFTIKDLPDISLYDTCEYNTLR